MSILNVNTIQPIGSGTTVTVAATELKTSNFITVGTGASVTSPSANVLTLGTNTAERLRIDSAGNLGVGVANPSEKLDVNGTIQCLNELRSKTGNDLLLNAGSANRDVKIQVNDVNMLYVKGDTGRIGIGTDNPSVNLQVKGSASNGQIYLGGTGAHSQIYADNDGVLILNADQGNSAANSYLGFNVDNSERLRITSDGKLLVAGADSYHGDADDLVLKERSGSNVGMTFQNTGTGYGVIYFADSGSQNSGRIQYDHSNDSLDLFTDGSERLSIDSGGTVHVNSPDTASGGRIYAASSKLYLQSGNGRQSFNIADMAAGQSATHEFNSSGNLVLASGSGIDFAATSDASGKTSELLDDYEEGTWTPTVLSAGSIGSPQYNCTYTKIGRLVTINADIHALTNTTSTTTIQIGGMPYIPSSSGGEWCSVCMGERYNSTIIVAYLQNNSGWKIKFRTGVGSSGYPDVTHAAINDNGTDNNLRFTLTYEVL